MATASVSQDDMKAAKGGFETTPRSDYVILPHDTIADLRKVLAWGLHNYGEIERVQAVIEMHEALGKELPEGITPLHCCGSADALTQIAEAFIWLDSAKEVDREPAAQSDLPACATWRARK